MRRQGRSTKSDKGIDARTGDPAPLGSAAHVRRKKDAGAERLGEYEGVPWLQAPLPQQPPLLTAPIHREACNI